MLASKKFVLSLIGVAAVVGLLLLGRDLETVKWLAGFVTTIIASFNVGQGIADGMSRGETSHSRR